MKIDASEMLAFYDSIEKLRWHTANLIELALWVSLDGGPVPLENFRGQIDGLDSGGAFANLSQKVNGYPLWGLSNLEELERIAKFSHTFRLACPTPEKPLLWRKVQPAWSTAILHFCAYSLSAVMAGWQLEVKYGLRFHPVWEEARDASLSRLEKDPKQFVSAVCTHLTDDVLRNLNTARVMLERESAWVCTEMRKSGVIGDFPDNQDIEEDQEDPELKQALRRIVAEKPKVKQKTAGTILREQSFRVSATTIGKMLRDLAAEGLYKGEFRRRDER